MIDKFLITGKLENFFRKTNPESFLKVFVISFLFDKINYIEKIVGHENSLNMLDKYIYNLCQNIREFKKIDNYHSIYAKYDFKSKCLKYYMTNDYKKFKSTTISTEDKKAFIIKEFKIMMYKEFETIINIYSLNGDEYILKEFQSKYTKEEIEKEITIINHLKKYGIKVPSYIKTINDIYYSLYKNKVIIIQKFIDGYNLRKL